jgi:ribosome-binding ATPase YchF (GTP1/OBG family)
LTIKIKKSKVYFIMLIGIVGKPNVGKSTFFKSLTLSQVEIANYPFTTIKANEGIGYVKVECVEKKFNVKCNSNYGYCIDGYRFIPVKLIDVPGLVPKAHEGRGLGNKFLDDLRQADALIHVVDSSGTVDEEGRPTTDYDSSKDIKWLEEEIEHWFYNLIAKDWQELKRKSQYIENKISLLVEKFTGLKINENHIKETIKRLNLEENFSLWSSEELMEFVRELRKISKPIVIVANKADKGNVKNIEKIKKETTSKVFVCSAEIELALREASRDGLIKYIPGNSDFEIIKKVDEKRMKALEFIKSYLEKYKTTGVQEALNYCVFELLRYIVVYPVENENKLTDSKGNILPDAFLMPPGSKAIDLAYKIHEDIGNRFVAAIHAITKQKLSKNYLLQHNDVIKILTH